LGNGKKLFADNMLTLGLLVNRRDDSETKVKGHSTKVKGHRPVKHQNNMRPSFPEENVQCDCDHNQSDALPKRDYKSK
jgi:hypothetical protein